MECWLQVSELTKRYNREHLTVWGNFSDAITQRCYKEVGWSLGSVWGQLAARK